MSAVPYPQGGMQRDNEGVGRACATHTVSYQATPQVSTG